MENNVIEKQVKSKERVKDHGEVFTNKREVNAMLDLVKDEASRVDSRFLEPACGNGNFLVAILERKLETVNEANYADQVDWEKQVFIAVSSIYGIDIQDDNCKESRERMYEMVETAYKEVYPDNQDDKFLKAIKYILETNVILGNGLSGMQVDKDNQEDLAGQPIVFAEFTFDGYDVIRKDFTMNDMVAHNKKIEEDKCKSVMTSVDKVTIESGGLFANGTITAPKTEPKVEVEHEELEYINEPEYIHFKEVFKFE